LQTVTGIKKDQPIETVSDKFSAFNYNMVAYIKTGDWMKLLEDELGKPNLITACRNITNAGILNIPTRRF